MFQYEGNILPFPDGGFLWGGCELPCTESVADGFFVLRWDACCDSANYDHGIAASTEPSPPPPFWVEWSFASNHLFTGLPGCDASFNIGYLQTIDTVEMWGDRAMSFEGGDVITGLEVDAFHTYRYETFDGLNYCFYLDGRTFYCSFGHPRTPSAFVQMRGREGCDTLQFPKINRWDFVRYGRITDGETIVSADPPAGVVDVGLYPTLDRFTVTFDEPNYVLVDQIAVEVSGGPAPAVTKTRRRENSSPEEVQIVLDRPLSVGETTRFTFDDGTAINVVEYTYLLLGACCLPEECVETDEGSCAALDGTFHPSEPCGQVPDCPPFPVIPTTTAWGLAILALLLLIAAKVRTQRA